MTLDMSKLLPPHRSKQTGLRFHTPEELAQHMDEEYARQRSQRTKGVMSRSYYLNHDAWLKADALTEDVKVEATFFELQAKEVEEQAKAAKAAEAQNSKQPYVLMTDENEDAECAVCGYVGPAVTVFRSEPRGRGGACICCGRSELWDWVGQRGGA